MAATRSISCTTVARDSTFCKSQFSESRLTKIEMHPCGYMPNNKSLADPTVQI
ncbi:hypothetical protein PILCRDRAFT_827023 [Piloderma croceum F 1598]|uniref:Uncharacterized protein n=1 Tax=Piloderma croceum (strain F 1598) TaxID=765440 RepID=A0A0C3F7C5_PILCF|nr:hypothetical protein PILCRDRAFT_827023 [Piloderma croceum F 1598]